VRVTSIGRDCISALDDAYATSGHMLELDSSKSRLCAEIRCVKCTEQLKGTLLLSENAPGVGNVIAVSVHPNISGWTTEGDSIIEGILEATVLYMPGGSDSVASARSEMPFTIKCPALDTDAMVCLKVLAAEASTLMSDRVELKCSIGITAFSRDEVSAHIIGSVSETDALRKRPGIILVWPGEGDSLWSIAKKYSLPTDTLKEMNGGTGDIDTGRALMIRI